MTAALLVPALAAALLGSGAPATPSALPTPAGDLVSETEIPSIYVEGQPFVVKLTVTATGEKPSRLPSWLTTPAGWLIDARPLVRRDESIDLTLLPGQSLVTSLDIGPMIADRIGEDGRDFRIKYSESVGDPKDVFYLSLPEQGIDFETLPKEQLAGYHVVLQTTGGPVWLELWPEVAPKHVRNFLDLTSKGYYDGSDFHRVIPNFMIQGGKAKDGSPPPRKLDAEFSSRRHAAGVLSAARLGNDINSATSEFFIVHRASPHLDGSYTAFGQVVVGMDSVDEVVRAVESHYKLINALKKNGVRIDDRRPQVATAMNKPNPPQAIQQALVVRASRSRPKRNK
ncbi:MAG: peptidylprolyl isomerase [Planctomycetota bacterium]